MLFTSLALHGVLFAVPFGASEQKKSEPVKIDEKPVKLTQLAGKKPPSNTQKPLTKPKVKPTTTVKSRPKTVVRKTAETPRPAALVVKSDKPPMQDKPLPPQDSPLKDQKPPDPPSIPTGDQGSGSDPITEAFAAPLAQITKEVDVVGSDGNQKTQEALWNPNLPAGAGQFKDPTSFFSEYSDPTNEVGKPGAVTFAYLSPLQEGITDIAGFSQTIEKIYTSNSFIVSKKGEYGGGPLYEIKKGSDTRYFSLVEGGNISPGDNQFQQTGWIVVIWKQSPIK